MSVFDEVPHFESLLAQTTWLGRLAAELVPARDRDDLVHDVLLVAMQRRTPPAHWRGWLATVARHLATRRRHLEERRRARERSVARSEGTVPSAADAVAAFATHRAVVNEVMALEEPYRTAVLLRFWEDLPPRAVARRTAVPVETARTRIRRGLERLRARLDHDAGSREAWVVPLLHIDAVRAAIAGGTTATALSLLQGVVLMKNAALLAVVLAALLVPVALLSLAGEQAPATTSRESRDIVAAPPAATMVRASAEPTDAMHRVPVAEPAVAASSAAARRTRIAAEPGVRVRGHVLSIDGKPVANATVWALRSRGSELLTRLASTDDAGAFEIPDVPGETTLIARASGWQPSSRRTSAVVHGTPGGRDEVTIRLGAHGQRLSGRVIDTAGHPVAHAWLGIAVDEDASKSIDGVEAVRAGDGNGNNPLDRETFLVRAGDDGRFHTDEVPWGDVVVFARGTTTQESWVGSTRVFLPRSGDSRLTVCVRPGAIVQGCLRDQNGAPCAGVELRARFEGSIEIGELERGYGHVLSDRSAVTAPDGRYRLDGLFAGEWSLERACADDIDRLGKVTLSAGQDLDHELTAKRAWQVRVRVQDPSGTPLPGWTVCLSHSGSIELRDIESARTDAHGEWVGQVVRDDCVVSVHAPDPDAGGDLPIRRFPSFVRAIRRGADTVIATVAPPTARIRGRVVDSNGTPAEGTVECGLVGFGEIEPVSSEANGTFSIDRLPAGDYHLRLSAPGFAPRTRRVSLQDGARLDLGALVLGPKR